jgi:hypothetical protein
MPQRRPSLALLHVLKTHAGWARVGAGVAKP